MKHIVLAVDPGKATGVALLSWSGNPDETPERLYSTECQPDAFANDVLIGLADWKRYDNFKVVCERFVINAATAKNSQAPYSLEQIGVLKHLCRENGYPVDDIIFQAPVVAKNMFPNKALQTIGVWHKGGEGHANDAIRHGLLSLVRSRWIPRVLLDKEK